MVKSDLGRTADTTSSIKSVARMTLDWQLKSVAQASSRDLRYGSCYDSVQIPPRK